MMRLFSAFSIHRRDGLRFVSSTVINSLCVAASAAMALQSLFLGLALVSRRALRSHANLALAIASFAFALAMGPDLVHFWGWDLDLPRYFWLGLTLPILFIPPFAYLHIIGMISGSSWRFSLKDARYGLFCLVGCLVFAVGAVLDSPSLAHFLSLGIYLATLFQGGYCLIASFYLTRRGNTPQIAWLRLLLSGLTAFLILHAAINGVAIVYGNLPWARLAAHLSALSVLYLIAWGSLSHSDVFQKPPEKVFRDLVAPLEKYRKSRQSEDEAKRILGKLDHVVIAHSLHREAGLTLPMLAAKIGAKPNIVSQALNQTLGLSFFDYINNHRIAEAKRMLVSAEETDLTILDVAYAVGFNSKSTFNAAFKRQTGQTPSLFRKLGAAGTGL